MKSPRVVAARYELVRRIGRGGSSTVWLARDRADGATVALKWLRRVDPALARQARAEVAALRLLQVPGVVALRDEGEAGGRAFVVMEHVAGDAFPGRAAPCAWADVEGPLLSLLDVLARVHALGVVHRDLKPANVLVREGRAVLVDFGVARLDAPWRAADPDAVTWGTLAYMAPEAAGGGDDPRSDLFAVGVMAFRALSGRFPFPVRGRPLEVLARRAHAPPPRWGAADVPAAAREELARLLAPRPDARPASAQEVAARLRATSPRPADDTRARLLARERWSEAELRALFRGHDRLLHLREDAARLLTAYTGGAGRGVAEELDRWEREGVVRRADGGWLVRRDGLDLAAQLGAPAPYAPARGVAGGHPDAGELAEWLALAAAPLPASALPALLGWPEARVRAALKRLRAEGRVARGRAVVRLAEGAPPPRRWAPERRREAHARVAAALPFGDEARLRHLLQAASDPDAIAVDACAVAERLAERGQLARAEALLREGARALRGCRGAAGEHFEALFGLWARVAVEQWTPHALDRLRYELAAPDVAGPGARAIASLLDAARATLQWTPQASALVARIAPFEDARLELLRQEVRVNAARRVSAAALREALRARNEDATADARRRRWSWEARLASAEERYEDAARLYQRGARGERWVSRRLRELLAAANAWVEAGALDRARGIADRARALAEGLRLPVAEGRAVWILRTIAWREGRAPEPDPAWVDAAREVDPVVARLMAFHEAMLAWLCRDVAGFRALFELTRGTEGAVAEVRSFALLRAMAADLGVAPLDDGAREALIDRVALHVPAIALQVAALTARAGALDPREAERAVGFARSTPRERWDERLDVLSVRECLARLGAAPPADGQ